MSAKQSLYSTFKFEKNPMIIYLVHLNDEKRLTFVKINWQVQREDLVLTHKDMIKIGITE